jgi:hypothetical protein
MNPLKSHGDMTHPCLTPCFTSNQTTHSAFHSLSHMPYFHHTCFSLLLSDLFPHHALIRSIFFHTIFLLSYHILLRLSTIYSDSPCCILSPDLQMQQLLFISKHFSITCCTVKIWSAQPFPGMKPHWTSQNMSLYRILYPTNLHTIYQVYSTDSYPYSFYNYTCHLYLCI